MNKKLINKCAVIAVTFTLVISIIYYVHNYSSIGADRKFDFSFGWALIFCDMFMLIMVLTNLYDKKKNKKTYESIIFCSSSSNGSSLIVTRTLTFYVFILQIFVFTISSSFIVLSSSFIMAMVFIDLASRQEKEEGIKENGISYFGDFYFWESIKFYKISEKGNYLKFKYSKKVIFFNLNLNMNMIIKE